MAAPVLPVGRLVAVWLVVLVCGAGCLRCPRECQCDLTYHEPQGGHLDTSDSEAALRDPGIRCSGMRQLLPYFFRDVFLLNLYKSVTLDRVQVPILPRKLFHGLWNISNVVVQNSVISTVEEGAFEGLGPGVHSIQFLHTRLDDLQPGVFYNLTSVHRIKFLGCRLQRLHRNTFLPALPNALLPDIRNSRLHANFVSIESSTVQRIETAAFAGLDLATDLVVRGNNISVVATSAFAGMTRTASLTFLENQVEMLDQRAFRGADHARLILIGSNEFERFQRYAFHDLGGLARTDGRQVTFQNNRLACHCSMLWILTSEPGSDLTGVIRQDRNKCSRHSDPLFRGKFLDHARIPYHCSSPEARPVGGSGSSVLQTRTARTLSSAWSWTLAAAITWLCGPRHVT